MKKLLAIMLAVFMVMGMATIAFADGSPIKTVTTEDLPQDLPEEVEVVEQAKSKTGEDLPEEATSLVSVADMTEEQKEEVNTVIETIAEEGLVPVYAFAFEVSEEFEEDFVSQTIIIELKDDEVVIINGKKYTKDQLKSLGNGKYEIVVMEPCVIVVARSR